MPKRNLAKPDHWSDIVGMPDSWDKENLTNLINKFKKTTFTFTDKDGKARKLTGAQWITYEVDDARESHQTKGTGEILNPYGVKSKETDMRVGTAMPKTLWGQIEEAYPTIFRDPKHYAWFVKNFQEFKVASKY